MKRFLTISTIAFALISGFSPLSTTFAAARQQFSIGTATSGGTWYLLGAGFASLVNKYVPDIKVTPESTSGADENMNLILRGKMDIAIAGVTSLLKKKESREDLSGLRLLFSGHATTVYIVTRAESKVLEVKDIVGKRFAVGPVGSGTQIHVEKFLKAGYGITMKDIEPAYLSTSEVVTGLKDKSIDAGVMAGGVPLGALVEMAVRTPVRLLSLSEEAFKKITDDHPATARVVIPRSTIKGVDYDVLQTGSVSVFVCRSDLQEQVVYNLLKAWFEHPDEKKAMHNSAAEYTVENSFRTTAITAVPFHPGAIRYYKERNAWKSKTDVQ